ncbi:MULTISPECIES: EcoAI/FtnUII family type I restriction enzme subunit R [Actibacterium]|uniref:Type I restriction enzyme R subunit n=1 Tax=Actibacterium naphthalenivorans TaxID=1614693 RepID=A0A840CEK8_9RHOB|nr:MULTISPECIES: type I restriction endonuclease subunit R [Actibacterium]ALG91175.1 restriction endonuclease subunit R [Actibacterium sp. EMB200-NS6]MBB4022532.1 type I restriction enzyme R subunit [Actibacterium naphthalenivorans]
MSIHDETEADTRAERIDPVLAAAGWGQNGSKVRREVICPGRIQSGGTRGKGLSADYVLIHKGQKLAVLEAKRAGVSHRSGVGQAKDYATRLGSRYAYASNGLNWYQIDMANGAEGDMDLPFPTPDELWDRTFADHNDWRERFGAVDFETDGGKWELRYYQHKAVNAALEALAKGDRRILLTLATGTGKTSIAFQIAWKLFQAKWNLTGEPVRRPRILFLADRNILADQAYNAFSAFPNDAVTRIDPDTIRKNRGRPPKNASLFFTIFQTFMTGEGEPVYTQYPPDFFDFIVIDECHRGGAKDESEWRRLLEYFEPAAQLGLTATPKRKHNADTYAYFGEPIYTYALRDGIEDGFLTPFKVRQMASTIDEYVYDGSDDLIAGAVEEGEAFTEGDFNTRIIIEERELSRVKEFMSQIDQRQKTLVFCATQDHAALVRDLINQVKGSTNPNYCHRVTADDGTVGEQHLRDFQDNDKTIPTVLTTSQKLSTGVDARNIRHIVLMRPIRSMIEFKQIIGRGTRTYEGKDFFTIWDFVKAHENFNDPEWDGEPLEPEEPKGPRTPPTGPEPGPEEPPGGGEGPEPPQEKIVVKLSDGSVRRIKYIASTTYWSPEGKPISAQEFLERLFGDLAGIVADEDQLRAVWSDPDNRERFLEQLSDRGYDRDRLDDIRRLVDAPDSDLFDVLSYILFTNPPKTRNERADNVRRDGLGQTAEETKALLLAILAAYEERGESELRTKKLGTFLTARYGSVSEGKAKLGGLDAIKTAFREMQGTLYSD